MNPAQRALLTRYRATLARYQARLASVVTGLWVARIEDIDEFTEQATPVLAGAKQVAVSASSGFNGLLLGITPSVDPGDVDVDPKIRGPHTAYWHALKEGRPWEEAVTAGRSVAEHTATDYITHTARRTGDLVAAQSDRTVRWQRVTGGGCDWCNRLNGTVYASAADADFGHERCKCSAVPVT